VVSKSIRSIGFVSVGNYSLSIEQMQSQVTRKDWSIKGPSLVSLKKILNPIE
jgi:hypothetical protein